MINKIAELTVNIKVKDKGKNHNKNKSPNLFYTIALIDDRLLVWFTFQKDIKQ